MAALLRTAHRSLVRPRPRPFPFTSTFFSTTSASHTSPATTAKQPAADTTTTTTTTATTATTTHFGFQDVPTAEKSSLVRQVFESVAPQYDVMNDLMSATLHRQWKDDLVEMLAPRPSWRHIDVAGGTGDVAFRIADRIQRRLPPANSPGYQPLPSEVVVFDINPAMLEVGKQRAQEQGYNSINEEEEDASNPQKELLRLKWCEGDAEDLSRFESHSFDSYTIAFGIRNVTNIPQALEEAHRVLKPGGRFLCLEFSRVQNALLREAYEAYSFHVIPKIGEVVANDRDSYQYLVESIQKFPTQLEFGQMLTEAGFNHVQHTNFIDGVVAIHSGFKLEDR
jgi:2-methoxy-6-polyprenyl-1,4-benzoquinol methylase